jgi:threonine/homoserine/homoserine lactone efflux protein
LGLAAGIAPGPLLSLVVSETLRGNKLNGILIAMAPLITDLPIVLISIIVLKSLSQIDFLLGFLSLIGGGFLIYVGSKNFKIHPSDISRKNKYRTSIKYGVVTNFLSPHPYLFWITVGAPTYIKASNSSLSEGYSFIIAFYILLIGSKMIIAWVTGFFTNFLQGNNYSIVMKALGIILYLLAGVMIYDGIALIFGGKF